MASEETPTNAAAATRPVAGRTLDVTALRALAHPLRVQILDELSNFGPLTASGLGDRLGESSGAMSYHLRQLAKHDIIREVVGKGSARERWWQMSPEDLKVSSPETSSDPAGLAATEIIARELQSNNERRVTDFIRYGQETLGADWRQAATLSSAHLVLNRHQLREFGDEFLLFLAAFEAKFATAAPTPENDPDAIPVQIQFNAFPLIDFSPDTTRPTERSIS